MVCAKNAQQGGMSMRYRKGFLRGLWKIQCEYVCGQWSNTTQKEASSYQLRSCSGRRAQSLSGWHRRFSWTLFCIMMEVMIESTHCLHTHTRSTWYKYKVFQHLLLWTGLAVIWMQPTLISAFGFWEKVRIFVGSSLLSCCSLGLWHPILFVLKANQLHTIYGVLASSIVANGLMSTTST